MWDEDDIAERSFETARRERVDAELEQWVDPDAKDALSKARRSEYGRALEAISQAALAYASRSVAEGTPHEPFDTGLELGIEIVQGLWWATHPYDTPDEERRKLRLWSHRLQPIYDVRSKKTPHFDRLDIEQTVGAYLKLSYRSEAIDRLLVDLLIAMEVYGFADEMTNEVLVPEIGPPRSPILQTHPVVNYFKGQLQNAIFFGAIGLGIYGLQRFGGLSDAWTFGLIAIDVGIWLVCGAIMTGWLPFAWARHVHNVRHVGNLIDEMAGVYHELRSEGPISVRHLQDCLRTAHEKGARWPAPLYALLDDVMARTGRV